MTEDSFLREVCLEAEKEYWQPILDEIVSEPDINIPAKADRRTINYIQKLEKKYLYYKTDYSHRFNSKRGLKALLIAAILIFLLSVSAFSFNPFKTFLYNIYTKGTEFFFSYNRSAKDDLPYSRYTYIPEGYNIVYDNRSKFGQRIKYIKGTKRIIIDSNMVQHSSLNIDTELAKTGEIKIGEYDGYYSVTESEIIVVWSTGKYYHHIVADLNGESLTLDRVIKIAESRIPEK